MPGKAHGEHKNTESALEDFSAGIDDLKDRAKASSNGAVLAAARFCVHCGLPFQRAPALALRALCLVP
jgi:hypothetical protein